MQSELSEFPGYFIDKTGRIESRRRKYLKPKIISPYPDKDGYPFVKLAKADGRITFRHVHRLVLETFVGKRPSGKEARHLNGVKLDSRLENLTWGTKKEQYEDRERHGTSNQGESNSRARLTEATVRLIRNSPLSSKQLAKQLNINDSTIRCARNGKTWNHIT